MDGSWFADAFEGQRERSWGRTLRRRSMASVVERLIEAGQRQRDEDRFSSRGGQGPTALLLGGLSGAMVVNVLHVCATPGAERSPLVRRMMGLTGALFLEWLATHVEPDAPLLPADSFATEFEATVGRSVTQAMHDFIRFVDATDGQPGARLRGTLYQR